MHIQKKKNKTCVPSFVCFVCVWLTDAANSGINGYTEPPKIQKGHTGRIKGPRRTVVMMCAPIPGSTSLHYWFADSQTNINMWNINGGSPQDVGATPHNQKEQVTAAVTALRRSWPGAIIEAKCTRTSHNNKTTGALEGISAIDSPRRSACL